MKSKFLLYFLFLLFSLPSFVFAQKKSEPKEKKDPYQLMSEYYGDQFNPFDNGNSLNYNLAFRGGYFLADYLSVGGSFVYSRDKFTGLVIQDSDTLQRNNIRSAGTAIAFLRTSFPLTKNKRLSFFNEIGLGLGGGNAVIRDIKNQDEIQKSYSDEFIFTAGISPGITFFAIENFAFEIQLSNLIGYTLNSTKTTTNDTEEAQVVTHNVNFNINLLSLNLGLAYFFGAKKNR